MISFRKPIVWSPLLANGLFLYYHSHEIWATINVVVFVISLFSSFLSTAAITRKDLENAQFKRQFGISIGSPTMYDYLSMISGMLMLGYLTSTVILVVIYLLERIGIL